MKITFANCLFSFQFSFSWPLCQHAPKASSSSGSTVGPNVAINCPSEHHDQHPPGGKLVSTDGDHATLQNEDHP